MAEGETKLVGAKTYYKKSQKVFLFNKIKENVLHHDDSVCNPWSHHCPCLDYQGVIKGRTFAMRFKRHIMNGRLYFLIRLKTHIYFIIFHNQAENISPPHFSKIKYIHQSSSTTKSLLLWVLVSLLNSLLVVAQLEFQCRFWWPGLLVLVHDV